jgi:hypothetical protein
VKKKLKNKNKDKNKKKKIKKTKSIFFLIAEKSEYLLGSIQAGDALLQSVLLNFLYAVFLLC